MYRKKIRCKECWRKSEAVTSYWAFPFSKKKHKYLNIQHIYSKGRKLSVCSFISQITWLRLQMPKNLIKLPALFAKMYLKIQSRFPVITRKSSLLISFHSISCYCTFCFMLFPAYGFRLVSCCIYSS